MAFSELSLEGRTAVVIGGCTGLGKVLSVGLARAGADVVPTSRREVEVNATADEVAALGRRTLRLCTDVTDRPSIERLLAACVAAFGKVDILANVAGMGAEQPVCGHPDALWDAVIDTNLTGCYRMIKLCLPGMIERGWGRIINIASTAANVGAKDNPAYCASKSGLLGLTRCVALEGAPHGVTCNAINPGFVNTGMLRASIRTWLAAEGKGVLVVLHQLQEVAQVADRVILLDGGVVRRQGPVAEVITPELVEAVYGVRLVPAGGFSYAEVEP